MNDISVHHDSVRQQRNAFEKLYRKYEWISVSDRGSIRGGTSMFLLKGVIIGLILGAPAGAVGALCMQRSLLYGAKSGLITGLGSSAADCFYAAAGTFGITHISDFLTGHSTIISIIGGAFIMIMGISALFRKQVCAAEQTGKMSYPAMFMSSLGVGITNPAAVIAFLFVFSCLGIDGKQGAFKGAVLVFGVLIGTLIWWIALSLVAGTIKRKYGEGILDKLNKVFGAVMLCFSMIIFARIFI